MRSIPPHSSLRTSACSAVTDRSVRNYCPPRKNVSLTSVPLETQLVLILCVEGKYCLGMTTASCLCCMSFQTSFVPNIDTGALWNHLFGLLP